MCRLYNRIADYLNMINAQVIDARYGLITTRI